MKKIFTKQAIKNLLKGCDEMLPKYMKVFNTYRDLCGDDVNSIRRAISGYAVVHEFGANVNISQFRSREAAQAYIRDIAGQENVSLPKGATCFYNRVSTWEIVKL